MYGPITTSTTTKLQQVHPEIGDVPGQVRGDVTRTQISDLRVRVDIPQAEKLTPGLVRTLEFVQESGIPNEALQTFRSFGAGMRSSLTCPFHGAVPPEHNKTSCRLEADHLVPFPLEVG